MQGYTSNNFYMNKIGGFKIKKKNLYKNKLSITFI